MDDETAIGGSDVRFRETLWTLVIGAGARSRESLETLLRLYWKPVYFFIRRRGYGVEEAKDLTQGFFAAVLEGNVLASANPSRGRFRTFLLGTLKNFLSNERDRAGAKKRGGGAAPISLDLSSAEGERSIDPAANETPEREFQRRWAMALVDHALDALAKECPGAPFEILRLSLSPDAPSHRELAAKFGMTESAVAVQLHRSKKRLQELVRGRIRESVASSRDLLDEQRDLIDLV